MGNKYLCSLCGQNLKLNIYLRRHVKMFHPNVELNAIAPKLTSLSNYKYKCTICGRNYNYVHHLKSHERKIHKVGLDNYVRVKKLKCSLCDFLTKEKKFLFIHMESVHSIMITNEDLEFSSFEEFIQWKKCMERDTSTLFILNSGCKQNPNKSVTRHYFTCHRSGYYNTRGKGKRHLKAQGSRKINGICPASIHVVESENGKCKVNYIPTHVGHQSDIHHLSLTKNERKNLAVDIANKVPFQVILDKIRDSVIDSDLRRIHLLRKKDLYNIENSYNLGSSSVGYEDNGTSVETFEEEIHSSDDLFMDTGNDNVGLSYENEEIVDHEENESYSPLSQLEEENESYSSLSQLEEKVKVRESLLQLADNVLTFTSSELEIVMQNISSLEETLRVFRNES